jgi:hypothetical protein
MFVYFLSLPSELRNNIYELCLLRKEALRPWTGFNQHQVTAGLLRANKVVHHEVIWLFYARNRFDFTECTSERVTSFLKQIGGKNASRIAHVYVNFPKCCNLVYDMILEDDSDRILLKIQNACRKLDTLTTVLHNSNAEELALVNSRFRAISFRIIVEVSKDFPTEHVRQPLNLDGKPIVQIAVSISYLSEFHPDAGKVTVQALQCDCSSL